MVSHVYSWLHYLMHRPTWDSKQMVLAAIGALSWINELRAIIAW
jgi:hypothetical protein